MYLCMLGIIFQYSGLCSSRFSSDGGFGFAISSIFIFVLFHGDCSWCTKIGASVLTLHRYNFVLFSSESNLHSMVKLFIKSRSSNFALMWLSFFFAKTFENFPPWFCFMPSKTLLFPPLISFSFLCSSFSFGYFYDFRVTAIILDVGLESQDAKLILLFSWKKSFF